MNIVMELMGIFSTINISIPFIGLKKNHYGSVILSLLGGYGLKNIYSPLFPYSYTIGVFTSCEIERKKSLNIDGTVNVTEYLPINFTLDHRYMDGVLSSKMVKTARDLFENPENFHVKE
jgi:hypothetical protein